MNELVSLYDSLVDRVERLAPVLLPTAARFVFAAVLLVYYWNSGLTKLGGEGIHGLFGPTFNAFAQIFPKGAEAVGYDITQASLLQKLVILGGTWAEFMLPAAIVLGLLTRLASIGMIGFIIVQSLTDIWGHGADAGTIGAWFDIHSGALILDQRAFWVFLLLYLAMRGAGPLSLDAAIAAFLRRGGPDGAEAGGTPASSRQPVSGTGASHRILDPSGSLTQSGSRLPGSKARSGCLTTRAVAVVDALGYPVRFTILPGQAHDLKGVLPELPGGLPFGTLVGDGASGADWLLEDLAERGAEAVIPSKRNRTARRGRDRDIYGRRRPVENFFSRIKKFRAIATRYDRTDESLAAGIHTVAGVVAAR